MLAAGIALAFVGLLTARSGRRFGASSLTTPTRVVIGLCAAVLGYHLIVWAFPPSLTSVQVDRQFWWVVAAAAILVPFLSLLMDRMVSSMARSDAKPPRRDDTDAIR
jgi:hypothetical protein